MRCPLNFSQWPNTRCALTVLLIMVEIGERLSPVPNGFPWNSNAYGIQLHSKPPSTYERL